MAHLSVHVFGYTLCRFEIVMVLKYIVFEMMSENNVLKGNLKKRDTLTESNSVQFWMGQITRFMNFQTLILRRPKIKEMCHLKD